MCFPESHATVVYAALWEFCGIFKYHAVADTRGVFTIDPSALTANFSTELTDPLKSFPVHHVAIAALKATAVLEAFDPVA